MTSPAPRITAGYDDDGPREVDFARAWPGPPRVAPEAIEIGERLDAFAAALAALCGLPARVTVDGTAEPVAWSGASDGARCGFGGGWTLAAALLARDCGGAFAAGPGARTPHVERCRAALAAALRDALFVGAADWTAALPSDVAATGLRIEVGEIVDHVSLAAIAAPAGPPPGLEAWQERLRGALDALAVPVRLVLHEGVLPVRRARSLDVGDVLPIATAHEVGLRVGTLALARAQIVDDGDGGPPRVRIVGRSRSAMGTAT